jgi:hypothetical protein
MNTLRDLVLRHATGPRLTLVLLANLACMATFVWLDSGLQAVSPGAVTPDVLGFVDALVFMQTIEHLGDEGRQIYLTFNLIDMVYPLAYSTFFLLLLGWGFRARLAAGGFWPWLLVLPLLTIVGDYTENICVRMLVSDWPNGPRWAVTVALAGHWVKWALLTPTATLGLVALVLGFKNRRSQDAGSA